MPCLAHLDSKKGMSKSSQNLETRLLARSRRAEAGSYAG